MNIVVNAVLAFSEPRGVGRYINNLLPEIAKIDKQNEYYIYYGSWMQSYSFLEINQKNFHFVELDIRNTQFSRNLYLAILLPLKCKKFKPDLFFLIDTQAILIKPCKIISTIHDLAEFVIPEKYSKRQAFIRRLIVKNQVRISDQILTVSNYTKNDICKRFSLNPARVHVSYNSVDKVVKNDCVAPDTYFLYVSEVERAKNLYCLIQAFDLLAAEFKNQFMIKVVGKKGNDYQRVIGLIHERGLESKVEFLGYVPDQELKNLYEHAYAFVFPSIFEGFGFPVLEAMASGIPVICSNSSSIPEVGGDAVLTFDPYDANDLAYQMRRLMLETTLRKNMIIEGYKRAEFFTVENTVRETIKTFID